MCSSALPGVWSFLRVTRHKVTDTGTATQWQLVAMLSRRDAKYPPHPLKLPSPPYMMPYEKQILQRRYATASPQCRPGQRCHSHRCEAGGHSVSANTPTDSASPPRHHLPSCGLRYNSLLQSPLAVRNHHCRKRYAHSRHRPCHSCIYIRR